MLALVALVEWLLARHSLDFTRFYIHDWRVAACAARAEARGSAVLCFGDSLVKFGIRPRVLEDRLGRPVYNLAVCDGQASSSYFLLRRALESGGRPSAVVVDFIPHLLATDPRHNLRQWPEMIDAREGIELGLATKHAGFFASLALRCLLPSVKDRLEIRGNLVAALGGKSASRRTEIPAYCRAWEREHGAMICDERPSYRGEGDLSNPAYFPASWRAHPINEDYVRRFFELAGAHGVDVYWLLPPITERFQARRDALGLEASYGVFVARFLERYPFVTVVDGRRLGYDHSYFIDSLHLSGRGATALSDEVARVLTQPRGPGDRHLLLECGREIDNRSPPRGALAAPSGHGAREGDAAEKLRDHPALSRSDASSAVETASVDRDPPRSSTSRLSSSTWR
jgi:hypothetical protein